ncbi:MAG: hypothetical protein C0410_06060 [Anaerolinea sp.]|nr:hypothetical protein [Anaerolinea sp.]
MSLKTLAKWVFLIIKRRNSMDDYLDVKMDIFEHTGQRARLRRTLTINGLIEEILKEFDDISRDSIEKYAIYLKGVDQPLSKRATIIDLDLQPQDELVFEYKHHTLRENLLPQQYAYLCDDKSGTTFNIQWQPAVIGRPTAEAEHNLMLAVDVQFIPDGMTISRRHAQITFSDDHYYIEPLTENNPIFINGKEIPYDTRKEINNQDKITFGKHNVNMTFTTQQSTKPVPHDSKSRPMPPATPQVLQTQSESKPIPPPPVPAQPPAIQSDLVLDIPALSETIASHLIVEHSTDKENIGKQIDIEAYPFILGRILPILASEIGVSRRHAEINFDSQKKSFTITDLQSTNGVRLEGHTLLPSTLYEIKVDTLIGLGPDVILKFGV